MAWVLRGGDGVGVKVVMAWVLRGGDGVGVKRW